MTSHTSKRTAASRHQASSPAKQSTQSPVAKRTRTRSASLELEHYDASIAKRGKRTVRQGSLESVDSNVSTASSSRGGRRKRAPRGKNANPDLSIVAEATEVDEEGHLNEEESANNERSHPLHQSPGGLSQMSGTTAITSASAQSSYTVAEVAGLDLTMVLEVLPGLWVSSVKLLSLLAPVKASKASVENIVRELKVPGSKQAKVLKHREEKFILDKESLGSDYYIRTSFILQKLFTSQVEPGMPRPDAILQAANLATLAKELLVSPKEALSTYQFFSNLDTWFPESFVTQFDDNVYYGNSTLLDESLELALDIRTQYTSVALLHHKSGEQEWNPDEVLTELFFVPPTKRIPRLSYYDDVTKNGRVKNLMRAGPQNTDDQDAMIRERVTLIREAFHHSEDATQAGDLVDFDLLEERFPWSDFLSKTVQWIRFRIDEIEESIRQQGGVDCLLKSLVEAIQSNNSQADIHFEPYPLITTPRQLLPSANIVPSNTGHSLFAPNTVRALEKMKQVNPAPALDHSRRQATGSSNAAAYSPKQIIKTNRPGSSRQRATGPLEPSERTRQAYDEELYPLLDDGDERIVTDSVDGRALSTWQNYIRDVADVENTPPSTRPNNKPRLRYIDEQPNAKKAEWSSQGSEQSQQTSMGSQKRKQLLETHDDSDSHDEGFQADRRDVDLNRRIAAPRVPAGWESSAAPPRRSPKRARVEEEPALQDDDQENERAFQTIQARQREQRPQLQSVSRLTAAKNPFDEDEEYAPPLSATQIAAIARSASSTARRRAAKAQSRTFWSETDTEQFIDLIKEVGCSWSDIAKVAEFEVERGQVALKDKARNLKVQFLKGGIPLPVNFDKIALGAKEIRSVQSTIPEYEP